MNFIIVCRQCHGGLGPAPKLSKILGKASLLQKNKCIYVDAKLRKHDWKLWCKAAVSGLGIVVTHKPFVQDLIDSEILSLMTDVECPLQKSYFLIYKEAATENNSFQSLIDWVRREAVV